MNKKILSVATAAVLAAPMAAQADIKMSGVLQAEIASVDSGGSDRVTTSADNKGALANGSRQNGGGPNKIRFDVSEDVGGGLSVFGRADWSFNTNGGSSWDDREKWVGLKSSSSAYFRMGRIEGAYKNRQGMDPFDATGLQARRGGGMSGDPFTNNGFVDNVVEFGYGKKEGLSLALQGVASEDDGLDGSMLGNIKYSAKNFSVFGAFSNKTADNADDVTSFKVGGTYKMGSLKLGLQYEDAELGNRNMTPSANGKDSKGEYIMGSAAYKMGNIVLAGWVGGFSGDTDNTDALSFSVGAAYNFSKRAKLYAGYHEIDSDTDSLDYDAFAAGIRYKF